MYSLLNSGTFRRAVMALDIHAVSALERSFSVEYFTLVGFSVARNQTFRS